MSHKINEKECRRHCCGTVHILGFLSERKLSPTYYIYILAKVHSPVFSPIDIKLLICVKYQMQAKRTNKGDGFDIQQLA